MGLLAGGFVMVLVTIIFYPKTMDKLRSNRNRRLLVVGLLLGFNLENSPMRNLRDVPGIGRFGMLLDPESTTALTRKYIWQGSC